MRPGSGRDNICPRCLRRRLRRLRPVLQAASFNGATKWIIMLITVMSRNVSQRMGRDSGVWLLLLLLTMAMQLAICCRRCCLCCSSGCCCCSCCCCIKAPFNCKLAHKIWSHCADVQRAVYVMCAHLAQHNKFQLFSLTSAAVRKMLQLNNVIMRGFNSGSALVLKFKKEEE